MSYLNKGAVLTPPTTYWRCVKCGLTDRTQRFDIHSQLHHCPAFGGVAIPLAEVSAPDLTPDVRMVQVERGDYGGESRYMGVRVDRPDGSNDFTVIPDTAHSTAETPLPQP